MIKRFIIAALFIVSGAALHGQEEILLCEGSGVHCMTIDMNGMSLKLVKAKGSPEIRMKKEMSN